MTTVVKPIGLDEATNQQHLPEDWDIIYRVSNVLSITTGIDAKTTGTTNLYTVPTGKTAVITEAYVRCTSATAITIAGTAGIGVWAGESDMFASQVLTGLLGLWRFRMIDPWFSVVGNSDEVIKLGIDVWAIWTSMTIAVDLIGYLI